MPVPSARAASLLPPQARGRPYAQVVVMAALGILALAKLGLLAADIMGRAPAGPAPAIEVPLARGAVGSSAVVEADGAAPMPAAGPDPEAAEPAAQASMPEDSAPPAAPGNAPAASAEELDPSRFSAGEIEALQQLAARRVALDQRARELDRRQALLETAAAALENQIAQLSGLRDEIAKAVEQHDAAEEAKIKSLVKIYETMKPKAAAEIFNRLEMPVLIRVVERMREPKSADVMARMDPVKAKQVTTELAKRSKLLETPADAPASAAPSLANGA